MFPMIDMSLDDEDILDMNCPYPIPMSDRAKYPYGLRLCLTESEINKLKIDPSEAFVGGMVHIHAIARITSVSCDETEGGEKHRIEFQIEDMAIPESEDAENSEADGSKKSPLYDHK